MSEAEIAVMRAEADLKEARAKVAQENHQTDKEALRRAITLGRQVKDRYLDIERRFHRAQAGILAEEAAIAAIDVKIAQHSTTKPNLLDDFPTEEQETKWEGGLERLNIQRESLLQGLRNMGAVREQLRLEAIGAFKAVEQQKYVVTNLRNKLADPEWPRGWEGGVSGA